MTQLHALSLTLAIEGTVGGLLLRTWIGWRGRAMLRGLLVVLAASLLTHPLAWQANRSWLVGLGFPVRAAIIEISVVLAETVLLALASRSAQAVESVPVWRWFIVSLAMNGASFGYGLVRAFVLVE
ncbi:MAG: hypothetical protein K0V04_33260 [Deltaproteobacteria bacterium]|nr:hypothetical protein [Deltaproteobacteria bacterium]